MEKGKTVGSLMLRYGGHEGRSGRAPEWMFATGRNRALLVLERTGLYLRLFEETSVVPMLLQN